MNDNPIPFEPADITFGGFTLCAEDLNLPDPPPLARRLAETLDEAFANIRRVWDAANHAEQKSFHEWLIS